jgi:hypothetical protein
MNAERHCPFNPTTAIAHAHHRSELQRFAYRLTATYRVASHP